MINLNILRYFPGLSRWNQVVIARGPCKETVKPVSQKQELMVTEGRKEGDFMIRHCWLCWWRMGTWEKEGKRPPEAEKNKETNSLLDPPESNQPTVILILALKKPYFGLLTSRTLKEYIYVVFIHKTCGNLLQNRKLRGIHDGRGVSGNYTNLFPGPIWKYN